MTSSSHPQKKSATEGHSASGVRRVRLRTSGATMQRLPGGVILIKAEEALRPYIKVLTDRLRHWAQVAPDRVCMAKRGADGAWRNLTFAQAWDSIQSIGQALLDRRLSAERPVAILSENDFEHFLLTMAGQHVGIPTAPISPPYSLISRDFGKLRHTLKILTPGMVFVADGTRYARALEAAVSEHVEVVATAAPPDRRNTSLFADLLATRATPAVEAAHERIDPDSPAKFLFTSGSTGIPKAVITTHRMICSNQQMIAQVLAFLEDEPPIIVDWLPWNHVFGGNHDVGVCVYHGGTFYIDDGKPGPGWIEKTVRNLREISSTIYLNVPRGYDDLLPFLRADGEFCKTFFRHLGLMFYAGAGLSQTVWDAYRQLAYEACGERIIMTTGLGSTETSPMAVQATWETDHAGTIGIPVPGVELKLVPRGAKLEARVRGPNVTPGYWRQPELTRKVFDEEGFYSFGDAVRFVDPEDVNKGLLFDGRLTEDFKLGNGTWVSVGPLRVNILAALAPLVRDAVIAGQDRDFVAMLIFADPDACRELAPELPKDAAAETIFRHQAVRARFQSLLRGLAKGATGSSNRVVRAILVEEPPSLDAGEVTDKGSLNQRAVLERRADLIEELYAPEASDRRLSI